MSNIFLLPPNLDKKERFAASWEYLLENVPDLGQDFVDFLTQRSGKPSSTFVKAVSYPFYASGIQPDILLECQDFDILCDHYLESQLSKLSLDALFILAESQPKKTYIAVISNSYCLIEPEMLAGVSAKQYYLQPYDDVNSSMPYFCWQDVYALVAQKQERLAHEFAEYMHFMDMQPWQHREWGNLFLNPDVAKTFSQQWAQTIDYFQEMKIDAKLSGYSALEVIYPLPWLQLLYIYAARSVSHNDLQAVSPYLVATIWIKGDAKAQIQAFHGISDRFTLPDNNHITVEIRASLADGLWMTKAGSRPKLAATYYTSLDRLVTSDSLQIQQNLLAFTKAVFTHAQSLES
ncbi:hypothetical protein APA_5409 [Pseudanabaena sp. lw0831]|uniref:hypothetical protein n=1 Tax=Pseudanabaena sp. lw0831 TaxID=1357935 RepID=UPI00191663CE|nr:hypothetical protein [Pseudanabaena sp. lw0831]GBO52319.1 hypothetical protein APA_5409 [Pseudanabaena sp. lw0831]